MFYLTHSRFSIPVALLTLFFFFTVLSPLSASAASAVPKDSPKHFIVINKAVNKLWLYESDGDLVKTFPVATGAKRTYTPEGYFRIVNKIVNRPYYTKKIPGGSPKNPLGKRWLGLEARGTYGTTYAIHGNSNESSIGKYVSQGCIRMHNKDIEWMFDQIGNYTPVAIVYSKKPADQLFKDVTYNLVEKGLLSSLPAKTPVSVVKVAPKVMTPTATPKSAPKPTSKPMSALPAQKPVVESVPSSSELTEAEGIFVPPVEPSVPVLNN